MDPSKEELEGQSMHATTTQSSYFSQLQNWVSKNFSAENDSNISTHNNRRQNTTSSGNIDRNLNPTRSSVEIEEVPVTNNRNSSIWSYEGIKTRLQTAVSNYRNLVNLESPSPPPPPASRLEAFQDQISDYLSLSSSQRFLGFLIFFLIGVISIIVSVFGLVSFVLLAKFFALLFTIGNVFLVISTWFIVSPIKQIKTIVAKWTRVVTFGFYIGTMLLILYCILFKSTSIVLIMLLIIIEVISFFAYIVSYIPYSEQMFGFFGNSLLSSF